MSTLTTLASHENADPPRLKRFRPTFVGAEREIRYVSMAVAVHNWLHEQSKSLKIQELRAAARVHFGEFVKENRVDDCRYMKLVEDRRVNWAHRFDHGVWSFRPLGEPQHRFFGIFACTDWVLVFNKQSRLTLHQRGDAGWHAEIDKALRTWDKLFPGMRPYTGTRLQHYVSRNAEHCDGRWY